MYIQKSGIMGRRWPTCSELAVGSTPTYAPIRFVRMSSRIVSLDLWQRMSETV
jgi:hypothetical protein